MPGSLLVAFHTLKYELTYTLVRTIFFFKISLKISY